MSRNLQRSLLEPDMLSDELILGVDGEIIGAITPGGHNSKPVGEPGKTSFLVRHGAGGQKGCRGASPTRSARDEYASLPRSRRGLCFC